ncbi:MULTISPECIES: hypothetical protein [unclassified Streptomyces]|uniref:hypothetical protein n=1 Tax=unclassified Streptomyces TaxID=2593676 RepID=UPI002E2B5AFC|nr:hypothetical protein [Streptomyces sp. NBC_01439]
MSDDGNAPLREPAGGPSTTVRRLITGLSLWWTAVPVVFVAQAYIWSAGVRGPLGEGVVFVLLWACIGGVVLAPVLGFAVAQVAGHTEARRRFVTMGALSLGFCVLVALFFQFAMECAPGDGACR